MPYTDYFESIRPSHWQDAGEYRIPRGESEIMDPPSQALPSDGCRDIPLDYYWDYRFDLMDRAEDAVFDLLGTMVDFKQQGKFKALLLGFCDNLEYTYYKSNRDFRFLKFRIDFSESISIEYSTRCLECIIWLNGRRDSMIGLSPCAMDDLRKLAAPIWEQVRDLDIWDTVSEDRDTVTVRRRHLLP